MILLLDVYQFNEWNEAMKPNGHIDLGDMSGLMRASAECTDIRDLCRYLCSLRAVISTEHCRYLLVLASM